MNKDAITILVPTRKRHKYLRNCLLSIQKQSRTDLISKVIVSENSDDSQSEAVANEFASSLPIHYIQQRPEIPVERHCLKLFDLIDTSFTALIADDDMWGRYHLEEAARAFNDYPEVHTFFGQAIVVCNETCYPLRRFEGSLLQIPDEINPTIHDFRFLSAREIAMHCMAHTPLTIFSIVSRTETLRIGLDESKDSPQPSTDKMLIWRLACQGPVAVGREISLFYRAHSQSMITEMLNSKSDDLCQSDYLLTREIESQARELGYDPVKDWRSAYQKAEQLGIADLIHTWSPMIYRQLIHGEDPLTDNQGDAVPNRSLGQRIRNLVYLLTPPLWQRLSSRK
jgi:hypothetical protein